MHLIYTRNPNLRNSTKTRAKANRGRNVVSVADTSVDTSGEVSSEGLIALIGGTGAGSFSRGSPSLHCSSRTLTRKASALGGKTAGENRLHSGTKK